MTDDRLKAAADRVRRVGAGENEWAVYYRGDGGYYDGAVAHSLLLADESLLADAYLAERLADDGEPITPDWLRSVGFREYTKPGKYNSAYLSVIHDGHARVAVHWSRTGDHYWSAQMFSLAKNAYPTTRGAVRRLARALGVPLKE